MTELFAFIAEHWAEISAVASGLISVATVVVKMTPSPKDDEWLKKATGFLSFLQHKDVGGLKLPGFPAKPADRS